MDHPLLSCGMSGERHDTVRAVQWHSGRLRLLDQRALPHEESWLDIGTATGTAQAIASMVVRGAPAIGIAAAYGYVLGVRDARQRHGGRWRDALEALERELTAARPTAVNLSWAVRRMGARARQIDDAHREADPVPALLAEARVIHQEDVQANHAIGRRGAALLPRPARVLTHCNTGSLATGGYGTALGVVRAAWVAGALIEVFATETRPWLQGARLTAWELQRDGIPFRLVADGAAASLMAGGLVDAVVVGADRVAANGDVANKIGTCMLACVARQHGIPFLVAAPVSTLDPDTADGASIPIEERDAAELTASAPSGTRVFNPVFDITPASLVSYLVTEEGVVPGPRAGELMAAARTGAATPPGGA